MKIILFTLIFILLSLSPMTVGAESDGRYEVWQSFKPIPIKNNPDFILGYKVTYDTVDLWLENGIDTIIYHWEPKIIGYTPPILTNFGVELYRRVLDSFTVKKLRHEGWICFESEYGAGCTKPAEVTYDTTFTYAYPPDSVLVCDTTWSIVYGGLDVIPKDSVYISLDDSRRHKQEEERLRTKVEEMLSVYGPQRRLYLYEPILEFDGDDIILIIKYRWQGDTEISTDTIPQSKGIIWRPSIIYYPERWPIDSSKIMHPDAVIVDKLLPDEYEIDSTDITDWDEKGNPKIIDKFWESSLPDFQGILDTLTMMKEEWQKLGVKERIIILETYNVKGVENETSNH